jgi:hypothetical protein
MARRRRRRRRRGGFWEGRAAEGKGKGRKGRPGGGSFFKKVGKGSGLGWAGLAGLLIWAFWTS